MSEAKFTKGEWELNRYTSTVNGYTRVFAYEIWCGNKCIVYKTDIEYPCEDIKNEYLANAHLIAAAPAMYRILELAMSYMDGDSIEDFVYSYQDIKQLLAKARGE